MTDTITVWLDNRDSQGNGDVGYLRLQPKGLTFDSNTKQWMLLARDCNTDRERAIPFAHMSVVIGGCTLPIEGDAAARAAIGDYYHALDKRENGVVALHTAFDKIERALGMSWVQGASLKDTPKLPAPVPTQKGVCISPRCECMEKFGHCIVTGRLPI